jgi:hypothetical protein
VYEQGGGFAKSSALTTASFQIIGCKLHSIVFRLFIERNDDSNMNKSLVLRQADVGGSKIDL